MTGIRPHRSSRAKSRCARTNAPRLRSGRAIDVEGGFTLVELLVSLLIFGMLSAAGVAILSVGVHAQKSATETLDRLSQIRRLGAIVTSDLAQAAPRVWRDEAGAAQPAFSGGSGQETAALSLVRRGWENFDGAPRSTLQKVEYRLAGDRIERIAHRHVDGAAALQPVTVIDNVHALRLRYRDRRGEWRERWDPRRPDELPRAVEMVVTFGDGGGLLQLFLVGAEG